MRARLKMLGAVGRLAALLIVSGCTALPKPFQRADAPPDVLAHAKGGAGVRVAVPDGTTEPMARLIAQSVVNALTAKEIPAAVGLGGRLRYALKSRVVSGGGGSAATPTRIEWRLMDKGDEPFFAFNHDVEGSAWEWEWGSPKVIARIGAEAARLVADAVAPTDKTLIPVAAPTRGVWVRPIVDAPGDGNRSLTRAMRFALMGAHVAVTSDQAAARHILEGRVALGAAQGKTQSVQITWTVTYPDGGTVGRAVQRNAVPVGTFDGRWGETASIIAAAALPGIKDVLDRAEETVRVRMSGAGPAALQTDVPLDAGKPVLPPPELSPEPELPKPPQPARPSSG